MPILKVRINEPARRKYKLRGEEISFKELRDRIIAGEGLLSLRQANKAAEDSGLRRMTPSEIAAEIKDTRQHARRA